MMQLKFLAIIVGATVICSACTFGNKAATTNTPSPDNETVHTPSSVPVENENESREIPDGWTYAYDGALQFRIAYPADFEFQPASNTLDESSVVSFDVTQLPNAGGIPSSEIKVAVTFFAPDDPRTITYEEGTLQSEQEITVDGFIGTRRVIAGGAGGSIATEVPTDKGIFLISAYPPDSSQIALYDQIIENIELDAPAPVSISQPELGALITSPVTIEGQALGPWFFEANIPVRLETLEGRVLNQQGVTTQEEWMTENWVDFTTELDFNKPDAVLGMIYIEKDNPSGLPENAEVFSWPVRFE